MLQVGSVGRDGGRLFLGDRRRLLKRRDAEKRDAVVGRRGRPRLVDLREQIAGTDVLGVELQCPCRGSAGKLRLPETEMRNRQVEIGGRVLAVAFQRMLIKIDRRTVDMGGLQQSTELERQVEALTDVEVGVPDACRGVGEGVAIAR